MGRILMRFVGNEKIGQQAASRRPDTSDPVPPELVEQGYFPVSSLSFGIGRSGNSRPSLSEVSVTHVQDGASPYIMSAGLRRVLRKDVTAAGLTPAERRGQNEPDPMGESEEMTDAGGTGFLQMEFLYLDDVDESLMSIRLHNATLTSFSTNGASGQENEDPRRAGSSRNRRGGRWPAGQIVESFSISYGRIETTFFGEETKLAELPGAGTSMQTTATSSTVTYDLRLSEVLAGVRFN
ncbi:MAG: hypothetical protein MHM6MM_009113 [Cercozoa sp. M6MM]